MYCSRPVARSPSVVRIVRPASKCGRQASFLSQPFFNRFPGSAVAASNDFAPFFRLFDDLAAPIAPQFRHHAASFQPRFDVREVGETYELRGEIPGVEGKDIEVEFSDPQTLVIRGRTEKETSSGTPPAAIQPTEAETTKAVTDGDNSDAASTYSTGSYQKPSVEEEGADQATPAESATEKEAEPSSSDAEEPKEKQAQSHYWISERSTGSFQRVFKFPTRVDQDSVTASLKNGILSVVVPKAAAPAAKKITVE